MRSVHDWLAEVAGLATTRHAIQRGNQEMQKCDPSLPASHLVGSRPAYRLVIFHGTWMFYLPFNLFYAAERSERSEQNVLAGESSTSTTPLPPRAFQAARDSDDFRAMATSTHDGMSTGRVHCWVCNHGFIIKIKKQGIQTYTTWSNAPATLSGLPAASRPSKTIDRRMER